ncbi:MAG: bifunctional (p)ppGpp synthetase/guanosine-3',5'-bis(diphosphate) 3'-pyrophosphohydrolase [Muribaculaceae bacterium]|nr:bifunctional (p)ppGpp synthetase/guanosine-3',5'-bis(diphosphate) 3'-pyrophosphohydrolase [Muribaculaceae bacterium]
MNNSANISPEQDDAMIMQAYHNLLDGYMNSNHRKKQAIIEKAFKFARAAHEGVRRRSGEPYIMHPIAVATIVNQEIGLGSTSICAALLHDVVEDTDYTVEDIETHFGKKVAQIVEGLTKISGGIFGDMASAQAENIRKLLLTMGDDIRVVLIKMADRLHNMRTLSSMPPQKQYKIAGETLYIYAPLAHRLGLFAIKTELEDLSFKYEHPELYQQIEQQISDSDRHRTEVFDRFAAPIRERLNALGLDYEFTARVKSCYSIWKKMTRKQVPFEEVYDLYAARIVFECNNEADEKRICWTIYSEITDLYRLHPDRLRDWISTPKVNGYRALHITVMGPDGNWVEVQIRSRRMDDIDERGLAAHWKYKIGEGTEDNELTLWLQTVQDILKNPEPNALDFLDTIKLNLFASEIQVFTPRGDLIALPKDASVLDMAFTLHTEMGTHCIAGKVNHKLVPLSHKLHSGDQVEVLTSHSQTPSAEWDKFLVTAKGKTRLRAALRHNRRIIINNGEQRLRNFLMVNGIEMTSEVLMRIINSEQAQNKDDLFYLIGNDEIAMSEQLLRSVRPQQPSIINRILRNPFASSKQKNEDAAPATTHKTINTKEIYELKTIDGVSNYKIATCCRPIPGDDVVGYIDDNNEVVVHKQECSTAQLYKSSYGSRLVQTKWATSLERFPASIHVEGIDRMGILQEIIYIISTNMAINMRSLNIDAHDGVFRCDLDVLIEDTSVVTNLCKRLKKVKGVNTATRGN